MVGVKVKAYAGKRINLSSYLIKHDLALSPYRSLDATENGVMDDIIESSKLYVNHLKMRPPHHQSMKSIDDYKSFTKRDLFDLIDRGVEVQSIVSTSSVFNNKKVFSRALQGLRMLQTEDSDDDDADFEKDFIALNAKANVLPKNPIVCIPSGHEEDLDAFKKVNTNVNNNNRFIRNKFNKPQIKNNAKQQVKK